MSRPKSIRSQILIRVLLPCTTMIVGVIWIFQHFMFDSLLRSSRALVERELRAVAADIDKRNLEAITIPETMALAQQHGLFGNRPASSRLARAIVESNPQLQAAYFGYEADADGKDAASHAQGERQAVDQQGRFLPYWYRAGGAVKLTPLVDMERSLYYPGSKNRFLGVAETSGVAMPHEGAQDVRTRLSSLYSDARIAVAGKQRAMITEPYNYQGTYIVEQTYPIVVGGKFKGIAGVDRRLDAISAFVKKQKPYRTADFFLISRRGRIITATMDPVDERKGADRLTAAEKSAQLKTKKIEETRYGSVLARFYRSDADYILLDDFVIDPVLKQPYLYAAARIHNGNWLIAMRAAKKEIVGPVESTVSYAVLVAFAGLVLIFIFLIGIASALGSRIGTAASVAKRVADGDLTAQVEVTGHDESGQLLLAVKTMIGSLSALIGQVKGSCIQLLSSATEIAATSTEQQATVSEFGASTSQVAAAAKQISATARQLNQTMDEVTVVASDTAKLATQGQRNLRTMEMTTQQLADASEAVSAKLALIDEKAQNISGVITVITKVADQTNLLSLNASIEAAKAGEAGAGFSVVAREIRRLADRTAVATLEIEGSIGDMQTAVSAGVGEMDRFAEQVRNNVDEAASANRQLDGIMERVQSLHSRFEDVSEGMRSQSQGASQIRDAITQLATSAEQTRQAVREFDGAAVHLKAAVENIRQEVSRFTLSD